MTISKLKIVWICLTFIKVALSVQGQFESLPAGEYRLQIGVVRAAASSTSPDWDLGILYKHSPAFTKHKLAAELTIQGRDKARTVVQYDEHSHHFNITFLPTF
jgi:hypothetical protein